MDIQLFATDEELQDFPENKTDSSTVQDKIPNTKSINLAASDLPKSHSDLPISSRLPERKSKCKSRRDHRRKSNPTPDPKPYCGSATRYSKETYCGSSGSSV